MAQKGVTRNKPQHRVDIADKPKVDTPGTEPTDVDDEVGKQTTPSDTTADQGTLQFPETDETTEEQAQDNVPPLEDTAADLAPVPEDEYVDLIRGIEEDLIGGPGAEQMPEPDTNIVTAEDTFDEEAEIEH